MGVIIAIPIAFIVYIYTFNVEFEKEDLGKAIPFIGGVLIVGLILLMLGGIK